MPRMNDCIWAIHDADFKSPIGELAQLSSLIALEASKLERRFDGQVVALNVNIAPASMPHKAIYGIQWRNL